MAKLEPCPIIIMGMHRAGTTIIARLLEQLGLFIGWKKDINHEAKLFLRLNDWILREAGGAWDYPMPLSTFIRHDQTRKQVADYLRFVMRSPRVLGYMGPKRYSQYWRPDQFPIPWGWKDPRNVFTLPLWLDLFPNAGVIYITRHGVDVAQSLKKRFEHRVQSYPERLHKKRIRYAYFGEPIRFFDSARISTLDGGLSLWEEYMVEGSRQLQQFGGQAIKIAYEDFLQNPSEVIGQLSRFCNLPENSHKTQSLVAQLNPARAFAFREDANLVAFASENEARLNRFE